MTNLIEVKTIKSAFEDERGSISDILIGEKIEHVGIIFSKANTVRGSHYHKISTQHNYILKGKMEFTIKDANDANAEKQKIIVNEGDYVKIPPNVIHALKAITDTTFLVLTSDARIGNNYEEDTYRVKLDD